METRDRTANLGFFGAAALVWFLVGLVVTSVDPLLNAPGGYLGAGLIGLALGLTVIPLFWLVVFAHHRRMAYRGDWFRAIRRGGWVAIVAAVLVAMRLQQTFNPPIALFVIALVLYAELRLTSEG